MKVINLTLHTKRAAKVISDDCKLPNSSIATIFLHNENITMNLAKDSFRRNNLYSNHNQG